MANNGKKPLSVSMSHTEMEALFASVLKTKYDDTESFEAMLGAILLPDPFDKIEISIVAHMGFYVWHGVVLSLLKHPSEGERIFKQITSDLNSFFPERFKIVPGKNPDFYYVKNKEDDEIEFGVEWVLDEIYGDILFMFGHGPTSMKVIYKGKKEEFVSVANDFSLLAESIVDSLYKAFFVGQVKEMQLVLKMPVKEKKKKETPPQPKQASARANVELEDVNQENLKRLIEIDERPDISFADISGQERAKSEMKKMVYALSNPKVYEEYGIGVSAGILLYGPPGMGKTLLAKAVAREANASFLYVQLAHIVSKWYGQSERYLLSVFQLARQKAPCIIFFDEFDAIASKRKESHEATQRLVATLLTQIDGFGARSQVAVIAATNEIESVDEAVIRSGRLQTVAVDGLSKKDQEQALRIHISLAEKRKKAKESIFCDIDYAAVISSTSRNLSGADIEEIVRKTIERKLFEKIEGNEHAFPIATADLIEETKILVGGLGDTGRRTRIGFL